MLWLNCKSTGFPVAERYERRMISRHVAEIEMFLPLAINEPIKAKTGYEIIDFANSEVPYYKDIYAQHKVTGKKILKSKVPARYSNFN